MAATLLCRHNAGDIVGVSYDQGSSSVLVTVQGDGVTVYDAEQRRTDSYALGARSTLEFQAACVRHTAPGQGHAIIAGLVRDNTTDTFALSSFASSSSARSFADAETRVTLPGPAHSCHLLPAAAAVQQGEAEARVHAAVVLNDGRVGVTDLGAGAAAGPLSVLPSPAASSPRKLLTASHHATLVVVSQQAPGSAVDLRVLRVPPSSPSSAAAAGLSLVKSASLPSPGGAARHATPVALTLSAGFALLQWSSGEATAVHGLAGGAAAPLRPVTLPLADAVGANGASSSTPGPAGGANAAGAAGAGRKRKNAGAAATPGGAGAGAAAGARALCAAVDERQFVVLDLESSAAQSQVCYSLHDAQFGCPLASGALDVDAPLLSLAAGQCGVVHADGEAVVLRLGGGVHVLHVRTQPVSLLALVARLSVSAPHAAPAAAGAGTGGAAGVGGRAVAASLAALPPPIALDPGLLRPGGTAAAAAPDTDVTLLQPVPASSYSRPADICASLVEQLSAVQPPATPPQAVLDSAVSYVSGRRQHAMAVPPQLLALTALGLAECRQWAQLSTLLSHVPPGGLVGCSRVLVAAAEGLQYGLLSRLSTCLDEVEPGALVAALQALLAPTTRSNVEERKRHHARLRGAAEGMVAAAEAAVAAAASAPAGSGRETRSHQHHHHGGASGAAAGDVAQLAAAQCGAAAVDGFTFREAPLHALLAMPVDAPAVQVALRRLPAPDADGLLAYLAKWVAKYTGGQLGEAAAGVMLPQELLFPTFQQALEWTRMLLDSHLTRLLMSRTPSPALESLEASLTAAVEGARRLVLLRGALEHVQAAAPLPAAHIAVATQYTAEVLDLRVR